MVARQDLERLLGEEVRVSTRAGGFALSAFGVLTQAPDNPDRFLVVARSHDAAGLPLDEPHYQRLRRHALARFETGDVEAIAGGGPGDAAGPGVVAIELARKPGAA
jgi:hypothetical protein